MNFFNLGSGYRILLAICDEDDMNMLKISRIVNFTYVHAFKSINELRERRLVIIKRVGRQNKVRISNKGRKIATYLKLIIEEMGEYWSEKNGE